VYGRAHVKPYPPPEDPLAWPLLALPSLSFCCTYHIHGSLRRGEAFLIDESRVHLIRLIDDFFDAIFLTV
jgi:hypothetical protein